jgi:hypothetical protein
MTIHLITDHKGEVFGIYEDRKLILQKPMLRSDEILTLLRIGCDLIVFSEADMAEMPTLPQSLDDIPITGLLNEAATIATIEASAKRKEEEA